MDKVISLHPLQLALGEWKRAIFKMVAGHLTNGESQTKQGIN
ncbi:hypothetical protein [Pediococcus claussenii]|nr:hypothetical protein [Pediococcus claussenii]